MNHWQAPVEASPITFDMELPFLLSALDAATVGAMITDRDGAIEWVSSGFTRITGYAPEEAIGRNPRILKSAMHTPSFYSLMWQTFLSVRPWRGTVINKHKNGKSYSSLQSISPVMDADG